MPFTVQQLIESHQEPITVVPQDTAQKALALMIEHDYSQLPVIDTNKKPLGIVTSDSILRALNNFGVPLTELHVSHAIVKVDQYSPDEDLFDLLDDLKSTYAVLITNAEGTLIGIVTSYDTTEYFRRRAEDMMYIEDIESTLKDFIRAAFSITDDTDQKDLTAIIAEVTDSDLRKKFSNALNHYLGRWKQGNNQQDVKLDQDIAQEVFTKHFVSKESAKTLEDLTLYDYVQLLLHKSKWTSLNTVFQLKAEAIRNLLDGVRKTRNDLAHFHGEISPNQRDQLHFCADWLEHHRLAVLNAFQVSTEVVELKQTEISPSMTSSTIEPSVEEVAPVEETLRPNDSRYAPLALWLQQQSLRQEKIALTFKQIEEIIGEELPPSAREHRSWWANDSVGHVQSRQWLDVGWRVSNIAMAEEKIVFTRIKDREKAYIDFFSRLLGELTKVAQFPFRQTSPDGFNWIVIAGMPSAGPQVGILGLSFARHERLRVEFYIDTGDKERNKLIFDKLYIHKNEIQAELISVPGSLEWERIDTKRGSRIALYHEGAITDPPEKLAQLRIWAVEAMNRFQKVIDNHVSQVL